MIKNKHCIVIEFNELSIKYKYDLQIVKMRTKNSSYYKNNSKLYLSLIFLIKMTILLLKPHTNNTQCSVVMVLSLLTQQIPNV